MYHPSVVSSVAVLLLLYYRAGSGPDPVPTPRGNSRHRNSCCWFVSVYTPGPMPSLVSAIPTVRKSVGGIIRKRPVEGGQFNCVPVGTASRRVPRRAARTAARTGAGTSPPGTCRQKETVRCKVSQAAAQRVHRLRCSSMRAQVAWSISSAAYAASSSARSGQGAALASSPCGPGDGPASGAAPSARGAGGS
jgi:hypothetical protein